MDYQEDGDYTPRFSDGRPMFVGLRGEALSAHESEKLLADYKSRIVAKTVLRRGKQRVLVSTVFLVLDRGFMERGILWETMVFGGPFDDYLERYGSRRDAKSGHIAAVNGLRVVIEAEQRIRARRRRMHANYRARA